MATSTQKIIIFVILLNLIISFTTQIYIDYDTINPDENIDIEVDFLEQGETDFESEEGIWGSVKSSSNRIYESTIGSPIKWGWTLLKVFTRSVNPLSISADNFTTNVEQWVARLLILFRSLTIMLVILEAYMVFKNKKQS